MNWASAHECLPARLREFVGADIRFEDIFFGLAELTALQGVLGPHCGTKGAGIHSCPLSYPNCCDPKTESCPSAERTKPHQSNIGNPEMAQIGEITFETFNGRTEALGFIRTLQISTDIKLVPTLEPEGSTKPAYRIFAIRSDTEIEIGAAWVKRMNNPPAGKEKFLSVLLDDPSFDTPLNIAAFPTDDEGLFNIVWRRRQDAQH